MRKGMPSKSRWWLLTVPAVRDGHDRTVEDVASIISPYAWAGQKEKGDTTGYEHYQILVHADGPISFDTLKRHFSGAGAPDIHIEPVVAGTQGNVWRYVHKEDTRIESIPDTHGLTALDVADRSGHRSDLDMVAESIRDGRRVDDLLADPDMSPKIARCMTWARDMEAAVRAQNLAPMTRADRPLKVYYVWGDSGIGKSYWVRHLGLDTYILPRPASGRVRWDDYRGESVVVMDEFDGGINPTDLNTYLDPYPLRLPSRYHDGEAAYTRFVILSNWPPETYYTHDAAAHAAWMRRLDYVIHPTSREDLTRITLDCDPTKVSLFAGFDLTK